ncbi:MAG: Asp23/Gls24 family envelope stress response protein [Clostridia bacterium]|nr:Asp23/Gls24 family envelope stress response protein [Clostridia bacterium]
MASKKDNLPTNVDFDLENGGTIKYANEVIAIIAGVAASEVDGIAGMCTSGGISEFIGRNRNITRGVKVEIGGEEASVELYIVVEYGSPIQKVASEVQENVRKAIETMTGLHVVNVDVHVQGVSFEREKKALQSGLESAHLTSEENARIQDEARQAQREEETQAEETPVTEAEERAADGKTEPEAQEQAVGADAGEDTEE